MSTRWPAQYCLLAAAMSCLSPARAGVWGSQPDIGISGDFNTDPALLNLSHTDESHAALIVDAPTSYLGDAFKLSLLPSFRLGNSQGYSQVDSDYEHLNGIGEFDTERNEFRASAGLARDSSLYHDYILNGATGVRRDTVSGDLNWDRQLSERVDFDTDVSSMRVHYSESALDNILTDYKYTSIAPTLAWTQTELGQLSLLGSVGRYNALDGASESRSANLELGFKRLLNEIWTLNASGGYSRALNTSQFLEPEIVLAPNGQLEIVGVPVRQETDQNGSVFLASLNRQTAKLSLTATASRQLLPSGFAFLSRQNSYELTVGYGKTERLSLSADLHRIEYQQPQTNGILSDLKVTYATASAAWRWTEQWTATLSATHVVEKYGSPTVNVDNSGVSLSFTRQFTWKSFQ